MKRAKPSAPGTRRIVNGRALNAGQLSRLKQAARAHADGRPDQARALLSAIEAELHGAADADWAAEALKESEALERLRMAPEDQPALNLRRDLRRPDGLVSLLKRGALTVRQVAAGRRYRERFEAARLSLGVSSNLPRHAPCGRQREVEELAERLLRAQRELNRLEAAAADLARIAPEDRAGDVLMVLREVAGVGRCIREIAGSGHRRTRLARALGEALDRIGDSEA